MTATMEKLLAQVQNWPEERQETWAARRLEEVRASDELEAQLAASPALLDQMALEALREDRAGLTEPMETLCEEFFPDEVASQSSVS